MLTQHSLLSLERVSRQGVPMHEWSTELSGWFVCFTPFFCVFLASCLLVSLVSCLFAGGLVLLSMLSANSVAIRVYVIYEVTRFLLISCHEWHPVLHGQLHWPNNLYLVHSGYSNGKHLSLTLKQLYICIQMVRECLYDNRVVLYSLVMGAIRNQYDTGCANTGSHNLIINSCTQSQWWSHAQEVAVWRTWHVMWSIITNWY